MFNQNVSGWTIHPNASLGNMFGRCTLPLSPLVVFLSSVSISISGCAYLCSSLAVSVYASSAACASFSPSRFSLLFCLVLSRALFLSLLHVLPRARCRLWLAASFVRTVVLVTCFGTQRLWLAASLVHATLTSCSLPWCAPPGLTPAPSLSGCNRRAVHASWTSQFAAHYATRATRTRGNTTNTTNTANTTHTAAVGTAAPAVGYQTFVARQAAFLNTEQFAQAECHVVACLPWHIPHTPQGKLAAQRCGTSTQACEDAVRISTAPCQPENVTDFDFADVSEQVQTAVRGLNIGACTPLPRLSASMMKFMLGLVAKKGSPKEKALTGTEVMKFMLGFAAKKGSPKETALTGTEACEKLGYNENSCLKVECCKFHDGQCLSVVGDKVCVGGMHNFKPQRRRRNTASKGMTTHSFIATLRHVHPVLPKRCVLPLTANALLRCSVCHILPLVPS